MKTHNVLQQTPEWFELRKQYPLTASNATAIASAGAGLETLVWTKMAEKYSTAKQEGYTNKDMERGNELEPQARSIYELETGNKVVEVGFVTNEDISPVAGASPDGLVNEDGNLEIKCPTDVKYIKMIAESKTTGTFTVESSYMWQMQMQMLMEDRKWTDYVVYNPNFEQSLLVQRIELDEVMIEKLKVGLKKGEALIKEVEAKLK